MNIEKDLKNEIKKADSEFIEYDELWDEIKKYDHNQLRMYLEALHVVYAANSVL